MAVPGVASQGISKGIFAIATIDCLDLAHASNACQNGRRGSRIPNIDTPRSHFGIVGALLAIVLLIALLRLLGVI